MTWKFAKGAAVCRCLAALAIASFWILPASAKAPAPPHELDKMPVVLLVDLGSGQVLYSRNPDRRFLPASMTKVMTAYVAFEEIRRSRLKRQQVIVVSEGAAREWNAKGTSMYLEAGERVSVANLLHGVMTASANDAAVVLAEGHGGGVKGWTFLMNDAARRICVPRRCCSLPLAPIMSRG